MTLPNGPKTSGIKNLLRRLKLIFRPIKYLEDYAQMYGDIFAVGGETAPPFVYIGNPEGIKQVLTAEPELFTVGKGNRILKFMLGEKSLILIDGDAHQRKRQLMMPSFHGEHLRRYCQTIWDISQQITDNWELGKPFAIRYTTQEITLQVILRVVFGISEGEKGQKLAQLITSLLNTFDTPITSSVIFFPFLQKDWGKWSPWGHFLSIKKQIKELIYEEIEARRSQISETTSSQSDKEDILTLLLLAKDEDGQQMTNEELHDNLISLLLAGHETTASALVWALYWIDYIPEVREKLRQEIASLGDNPDLMEIARLPYLSAVCAETLRIYPIVPSAFIRVPQSPIEIMGYQFPAGSALALSIYLLHHREDLYPQPQQFKPERFLERQFSAYEYLPFGGSNRRCMGSALALLEMKLVIASIVSRFDLKLVNKFSVKPIRRGLTFAPPNIKTIAFTRS